MRKKVLITGASKGIGNATARILAERGWDLFLTARNSDELVELRALLRAKFPEIQVITLPADLAKLESLEALVDQLMDTTDKLDAVVLKAGVGVLKPILQMTEDDYEAVMGVNLKGNYFFAQAVFPLLKQSRCPRVVGITSDVARRTFADGSVYTMSKYAQDAFFHTLRKEWRSSGIRVTVIMPGLTDTSFGGGEAGAPHKAEWLRPEDVAESAAFALHSPDHVVIDELMIHPFCQDWQP